MAEHGRHQQWTPDRRGLVLRGAALAALGAVPALGGRRRVAAEPNSDPLHTATAPTTTTTGPLEATAVIWARPMSGDYPVSARYGIPGNWRAGRHTGIDFATPVGVPVHAVGPGKVVLADRSGDYGKAVKIEMDDGCYTLVAHLSEICVGKGSRVAAGGLLGRTGSTGRVTGPHLHFEVRTSARYGSDIDPVAYLAQHGVQLL